MTVSVVHGNLFIELQASAPWPVRFFSTFKIPRSTPVSLLPVDHHAGKSLADFIDQPWYKNVGTKNVSSAESSPSWKNKLGYIWTLNVVRMLTVDHLFEKILKYHDFPRSWTDWESASHCWLCFFENFKALTSLSVLTEFFVRKTLLNTSNYWKLKWAWTCWLDSPLALFFDNSISQLGV